jgi:hypothetical protein
MGRGAYECEDRPVPGPAFTLDDDLLVPTEFAVSPWSDEMVNGRHVAGLVAWAVERDHPTEGDGLRAGRLTVDMFRAVPMQPLRLTTRVARAGRRIAVVDVSLRSGDVEVTRGSVLRLAAAEHPDGSPWAPDSDMPDPEPMPSIGRLPTMAFDLRGDPPLGQGRGRSWLRELGDFVAGEAPSPLVRAALAADFVNPLANSAPGGLRFINADLTVHLARYPRGEWVGLESVGHVGADGVAVGSAWLHDRDGRFGQCLTTALPDGRIAQRISAR